MTKGTKQSRSSEFKQPSVRNLHETVTICHFDLVFGGAIWAGSFVAARGRCRPFFCRRGAAPRWDRDTFLWRTLSLLLCAAHTSDHQIGPQKGCRGPPVAPERARLGLTVYASAIPRCAEHRSRRTHAEKQHEFTAPPMSRRSLFKHSCCCGERRPL